MPPSASARMPLFIVILLISCFFPPLNKNTPSVRVCVCFYFFFPTWLLKNQQPNYRDVQQGQRRTTGSPDAILGGGGPMLGPPPSQRGHFNGGLEAFPLVLGTPFVLLPLTPRQTHPHHSQLSGSGDETPPFPSCFPLQILHTSLHHSGWKRPDLISI